MKVNFITPLYNASENLETLIESVRSQKNDNWTFTLVDDISSDNTVEKLKELIGDDNRFNIIVNNEKKFALRNIVETSKNFSKEEDIVAIIDGDDSLCNTDTVSLLINEYSQGAEVVWTAHKWDINQMNISRPMPDHINPYYWPWSSSHLKTFKGSILSKISDENFKDLDGNWFERGYDQALMLPIIYLTKNRKFINEVCYLYNINSVSVDKRVWEESDQMFTINLVRARGFVS